MTQQEHKHPIPSGGAGHAVSESKTLLRDNLESIVLAILMVLVVRQVVVEAFKIPTGSMAPTLLGVHKEVRCPNCGWTFQVGDDKVGMSSDIKCPNCHYQWPGASTYYPGDLGGEPIDFRRPAWLWNEGTATVSGQTVRGIEAANRVNRWGSRIFVNKFIYSLRQPRRWEVAVFRYPFVQVQCNQCGWSGELEPDDPERCPVCQSDDVETTRKNYIKRVVGLPDETVMLRNGDVFVRKDEDEEFRIARKPPGVQKRLWLPVFDSSYVPRELIEPRWEYLSGTDLWNETQKSGGLYCRAEGRDEPAMVAFARLISDRYAYNGTKITQVRKNALNRYQWVGDVRLDLEFRLSPADQTPRGSIYAEITENDHRFQLVLSMKDTTARLLMDGEEIARARLADYDVHESGRLSFENYDDRLLVRWNGNIVIQTDYTGEADPSELRQKLTFGARNADVCFERIRIYRDIYYLGQQDEDGTLSQYEMGPDGYMLLGDNSPSSSDSRAWKRPQVSEDNFMGEAFGVFWPIHDMGWLSLGSEGSQKKGYDER